MFPKISGLCPGSVILWIYFKYTGYHLLMSFLIVTNFFMCMWDLIMYLKSTYIHYS